MFKRKGTYYAMTAGCTCFGLGASPGTQTQHAGLGVLHELVC